MTEPFKNRIEGARALAPFLKEIADPDRTLVLALPRGGVPVGHELASRLAVPFDILLVRKLGVPGHEELAFGAIAANGAMVLNESIVKNLRISEEVIASVANRERRELERRERAFRPEGKPYEFAGMRLVIAAPVGSVEACERMEDEYGVNCVCAERPVPFLGVGRWYYEFPQLSDEDVRRYLEYADGPEAASVNG